jgi:hypothetical protein
METESLDVASPIIARTGPLISKADDLANQGLDMVESRFPSKFFNFFYQINWPLMCSFSDAQQVRSKRLPTMFSKVPSSLPLRVWPLQRVYMTVYVFCKACYPEEPT